MPVIPFFIKLYDNMTCQKYDRQDIDRRRKNYINIVFLITLFLVTYLTWFCIIDYSLFSIYVTTTVNSDSDISL